MPTYEYICSSCDKAWDELRKIADRKNQEPCDCGGHSILRVSAPTVHMPRSWVTPTSSKYEPPPWVMSTRELGEGMPVDEWKEKRRKKRLEHVHKKVKDQFGIGKFERLPDLPVDR